MSTAVVEPVAQQSAPSLPPMSKEVMNKAVCIVVSRGMIGFTRTVRSSQVEVNADKSMVHVTKELFNSPELKAIASLDGKFNEYLASRCLPSLFKRSAYLLSNELIAEVDEMLIEHVAARQVLIDKFCAVYDQAVIAAKEQLRELFDPTDYPPVEQVRGAFKFSWQYVQFGVSESLKTISKAMFEREQKKAQAQWVEASEAIQQLLRASMAELTNHMVTVLTPGENGKKKRFHKSMLDNINDFLATFSARNLTDDVELAKLVDKAKQLTEGVTPEALRSNEGLRSAIQAGFAEIKTQLDPMVVEAPSRAISLED